MKYVRAGGARRVLWVALLALVMLPLTGLAGTDIEIILTNNNCNQLVVTMIRLYVGGQQHQANPVNWSIPRTATARITYRDLWRRPDRVRLEFTRDGHSSHIDIDAPGQVTFACGTIRVNVDGAGPPPVCRVSTPNVPTGSSWGFVGQELEFTASGASCSQGHAVHYRFDWGDGNLSSWGSATRNHSWDRMGQHEVKAQARCTSTSTLSSWGAAHRVNIAPDARISTSKLAYDGGETIYYGAPDLPMGCSPAISLERPDGVTVAFEGSEFSSTTVDTPHLFSRSWQGSASYMGGIYRVLLTCNGQTVAKTTFRVGTIPMLGVPREYLVRITYVSWEDTEITVDPDVLGVEILPSSPTGQPGEQRDYVYGPAPLPQNVEGRCFRIWVREVDYGDGEHLFLSGIHEAVVHNERVICPEDSIEPEAVDPLTGTSWVLERLMVPGASSLEPPLPGTLITLSFRDGRLGGSNGCNLYGISYTVDGSSLNVGEDFFSTMKYCYPDEIMQQGSDFVEALKQVRAFHMLDQLWLMGADNVPLAVFHPDVPGCARCLAALNAASVEGFSRVDGITPRLAEELVDHQPFDVDMCTLPNIRAALEEVHLIGPARSEAITRLMCPWTWP